MKLQLQTPSTAAAMSVVIGCDSQALHDHAVLIGHGLTSDRRYQLKVGNTEVSVSRDMTAAEFESIYQTLKSLIATPWHLPTHAAKDLP